MSNTIGLVDMFASKGGTNLTGMLAMLSRTDEGKQLLTVISNKLK